MILRGVVTEPKRLPQELLGVFLFFFGIIVLLSLATFDANDRHLNHVVNAVAPVQNSAGVFGAYLAGLLVDFFGLSSYFIPAILVYSGGRKILGRQQGEPWRKVSSMLFWLCFASLSYYLDIGLGDVRGGGLLGVSVGRFAIQFFSPIGATLVWIFFMLFAAQLHFNFSWLAFITQSVVDFWNKTCTSCHKILDALEKTVIRKSRHTQPLDVKDAMPSANDNMAVQMATLRNQEKYNSEESHSAGDATQGQQGDYRNKMQEQDNAQSRQQSSQAKSTWVSASALTHEVLGTKQDWSTEQPSPLQNDEEVNSSKSAELLMVRADDVDDAATSIKSIIERPQQLQTLQPPISSQDDLDTLGVNATTQQQVASMPLDGQQVEVRLSSSTPDFKPQATYQAPGQALGQNQHQTQGSYPSGETQITLEQASPIEPIENQYPVFTTADEKLLRTGSSPLYQQPDAAHQTPQTPLGVSSIQQDPLLAQLLSATEQMTKQEATQKNGQAAQPEETVQSMLEEDNELAWLNGPSPLQARLEALKKQYGPEQPTPTAATPVATSVQPVTGQIKPTELPTEPIELVNLVNPSVTPDYDLAPKTLHPATTLTAQASTPTVVAPKAPRITVVPEVRQQVVAPAPVQQPTQTSEPKFIPAQPIQPVQETAHQNITRNDRQNTDEQDQATPESRTYTIGMEEQPPLTNLIPGVTHEAAVIKPALDPRLCKLPSLDLLEVNSGVGDGPPDEVLDEKARSLMACLSDFGIQGELTRIVPGPVVTMFEVKPAPGVRVARIANLNDDLALALKAIAVRVQAPIPGSDTVGIEIPNEQRETVSFRDILDSKPFNESESFLTMALGKDIAGNPVAADLAKMPHLLVAGATGAGKSVCLNSILLSLLYKAKPHELQLLLIDPKRIEMAIYADLPHLVHPVVTEMALAKNALEWAVAEMDRRYTEIARLGVRNILGYNNKLFEMGPNRPEEFANIEPMPYMVIIIDELADLMLTAAKDVETSIVRLAQLARAAGIHLILATQRPSVDVVTGLIKANFPCRISFQVTSKHDSRTILDTVGAEHLLGKGDMLFKPGGGKFQRLHGAFVSDDEVGRVADFWRGQMPPAYKVDFSSWGEPAVMGGNNGDLIDNITSDPMYAEAVDFVSQQGKASISLIQRRFRIGFNRAARYVEQMEHDGLIGPADGSKPRLLLR